MKGGRLHMARVEVSKVYRDTILGHSLKGMDKYYLKPSEDDLHFAMERYSDWLQGEIANVDNLLTKTESEKLND